MTPLVATAANRIPNGAIACPVTAPDGIQLRAVRWRQTTRNCRGTILLLQGRAEFIEKYFETVTMLRRRGFCVMTFDWRGQGGSQRLTRDPRKGHVRRFADYGLDLDAVFSQVIEPSMPRPVFALAHSMGASVLLDAMQARSLPIERMVLLAPMLALADIARPTGILALTSVLATLGLSSLYVPGGGATSISTRPFAANRLTSDVDRYVRNADVLEAQPQLGVGDPTIGWVRGAFALMQRLTSTRFARGCTQPMLVLMAGDDPIVSTPAIERFAAGLKAGRGILIERARHEILMERDEIRALFWAAFDAFIPGSLVPVNAVSADPSAGQLPDQSAGSDLGRPLDA